MDFIGEDFNGSVEYAMDKLDEDFNVLNQHVRNLLKEIIKVKADVFNIKRELVELKEIK